MCKIGIIIGIDVGGSTTKIVGFSKSDYRIIDPIFVKAGDPVASAYGAFGKFTDSNNISISDIDKVMITGVGSSFINNKLYGIDTQHVTEFECVGLGGLYLSKLSEAIIVSMGTGTAIVRANRDGLNDYMGGTGVGGGTLIGLSKKMLGVSSVDNIVELALTGNLDNIDLRVSDITNKDILPGLPAKTTAANFGKVSDIATNGDIALGIINMIFESVGVLAIFSAKRFNIENIVLTGNLTTIPQAKPTFEALSAMFGINFVIPQNSQFGTVIGAALSQFKNAKDILI